MQTLTSIETRRTQSNITLFLFQETVALPTTKKQSKGFQTSEKVACLDFSNKLTVLLLVYFIFSKRETVPKAKL